jgi:hypothetical protein
MTTSNTFTSRAGAIEEYLGQFDQKRLEQVDVRYFNNFKRELTSRVINFVTVEFRIIPKDNLMEIVNYIEELLSMFTDLIDVIRDTSDDVRAERSNNARATLNREQQLIDFERQLDSLKGSINNVMSKLSRHIILLCEGEFFLPLEKLWVVHQWSFNSTAGNGFRRTAGVSLDEYRVTTTNVVLSHMECASNSGSSSTTSLQYVNMHDIFGNAHGRPESAHLMPHATPYASLWFAVVDWVLFFDTNVNLNYDLRKKCINGVKPVKGTASVAGTTTQPRIFDILDKPEVEATKTGAKRKRKHAPNTDCDNDNSNTCARLPKSTSDSAHESSPILVHKRRRRINKRNKSDTGAENNDDRKPASITPFNKATTGSIQGYNVSSKRRRFVNKNSYVQGDLAERMQTYAPQPAIASTDGVGKRLDRVGIKHFRTNRIRLENQANYLDTDPCVVIVPILSDDEVANWNGAGYSAIVLAGAGVQPTSGRNKIKASYVYKMIGASEGGQYGDYLATSNDVNVATELLQLAVLSIAKSCRTMYKNGEENLKMEVAEKKSTQTAYNDITKRNNPSIPVPVLINRRGPPLMKIRKVTFSALTRLETSPCHFAPNPALLLAKAASNWLKRQKVELLPGCDLNGGNVLDDEIDCFDTISYRREATIIGCAGVCDKIPTEILCNEDPVTISDKDNDSLSDVCED